jgi:hypothetical protein
MGEFRIGRTFARHSYPDTPRAGGLAALARNSAFGPDSPPLAVDPVNGTKLTWQSIEVGTPGGTVVPITPKVTGIVRVIVNVVFENAGASDVIGVDLLVNGSTTGTTESTIDASSEGGSAFITIPWVVDFAGGVKLPVGPTYNLEVKVAQLHGSGTISVLGVSSIDIQELPPATG